MYRSMDLVTYWPFVEFRVYVDEFEEGGSEYDVEFFYIRLIGLRDSQDTLTW